jgi:hypothetical protein
MKKVFGVTTIIISSIFISISCSKSSTGGGGVTSLDCNTVTNKAFAADINPVIQASCALVGCHNAGSFNGPGALTNYNEIFTARSVIQSAVSSGRMPKTGTLATSQKNSILCWIDGGAPNN